MKRMINAIKKVGSRVGCFLNTKVCFGKSMADAPDGSIVFFPYRPEVLNCGLAGIVSVNLQKNENLIPDSDVLCGMINEIEKRGFESYGDAAPDNDYLGGLDRIEDLWNHVSRLKRDGPFYVIFSSAKAQEVLSELSDRIGRTIEKESSYLSENMGKLESDRVDIVSGAIEKLRDITWRISVELLENVEKAKDLISGSYELPPSAIVVFKKINAVLNSIDRLEVRGRDSSGVSLMFVVERRDFDRFVETLEREEISDLLSERTKEDFLCNGSVRIREIDGETLSISIVYKVAAEIGSLGDNVSYLREQIKADPVLQILAGLPHENHTVSSHTRWASVGAITVANCHPVDNKPIGNAGSPNERFCAEENGIIHVCLNGDIDNYKELLNELSGDGIQIHPDITTDTKIIPMRVEKYISDGFGLEEAFRLAVNDFEGSHAISMHTDLAPGKLFLAQKGSGQAIFIGLADDHYIEASEVYGFVEETQSYLKLNGEKVVDGLNGKTQGQIFILDQDSEGGLDGVRAMYYDGTPLELTQDDVKTTEITSRDIDRQGFPHYFLKEISESPASVEKTLQNRWKILDGNEELYAVNLGEDTIPGRLAEALVNDKIRRIYFIGQGTAGISAQACAQLMRHYMDDTSMSVDALKASEMSGFMVPDDEDPNCMSDALIVGVTQSGTTTDTNRAMDMVKARGAYTLAIVNRRDSDITFKVDGVLYTSSGRDVEMSVASTKAFYSQIVAGAVLGLYMAKLKSRRSDAFVTDEIKRLLSLPDCMRKILEMKPEIEASARRLSTTRTYWAAVGSGPNKASADEIRIKLSELCYKTISSDYIEDKKHIDLSSEPLIIVCAAGTRDTVIGDIIKDTAIFHAHKAAPIVIADEGETRFTPYANDVFYVPAVGEHLAPIVNTLAGHIWGYYAALSINEGSRFLHRFREEILALIDNYEKQGMKDFEFILEKDFREKIVEFYVVFRQMQKENRFPSEVFRRADMTLLLKYLSGRLQVSDFEIDFGKKGTAAGMLEELFDCLGNFINYMSRPVDAIKHQAKTVTVGTSRVREKIEGMLFEALYSYGLKISQLTPSNVNVLKNLQSVVSEIQGSVFYKISSLNKLGEPTDDTMIELINKEGVTDKVPSRVEADTLLKGTKKIIVRRGTVWIGTGRKDDRHIVVVPIISTLPSTTNMIEHLLLLHVGIAEDVSTPEKVKALGGKYENIKNIVQEKSAWDDSLLDKIRTSELFGMSAEKVSERIAG